MEKEKFVKVTLPDGSWFITDSFEITMVDCVEENEEAKISFVKMTRKQFEKLPEYEW